MKSLVPNRKCQSQRLVAVQGMDCEKFKRIGKVEIRILTEYLAIRCTPQYETIF